MDKSCMAPPPVLLAGCWKRIRLDQLFVRIQPQGPDLRVSSDCAGPARALERGNALRHAGREAPGAPPCAGRPLQLHGRAAAPTAAVRPLRSAARSREE